jgi:SAM-dependent methyltransferase
MNIDDYAIQLEQFEVASEKCGQPLPLRGPHLIPILDEDAPDHTGKELCWSYVLHCAWAARMLAKNKPERHVDFGSYAYFAALCSAFVPQFEFYDIRGLGFEVPSLHADTADLMKLPFPDDSIESISCLHVLEHVGLGRYGDMIDPEGHLKAAKELERVLAPGGKLLIVLPMSQKPYVAFNAHRILSLGTVKKMFSSLTLQDWFWLYDKKDHIILPFREDEEYTGCLEFSK